MEQGHGKPEELTIEPIQRPLRPLSTAEKLAATNVDVKSLKSVKQHEVDDEEHEADNGSRRNPAGLRRIWDFLTADSRRECLPSFKDCLGGRKATHQERM